MTAFEWRFLLNVEGGDLHLLGLPARVESFRSTLLALGSGVPSALAVIAAYRYLNAYVSTALSDSAIPFSFWSTFSLILGLLLWAAAMIGLIDLLDFLTIRVQAQHAVDFAILNLKEIQTGRFRHTLKVSVGREVNLHGYKPITKTGDFLVDVAATRQGLRSALAPFQKF